jgi:hypothetical protein
MGLHGLLQAYLHLSYFLAAINVLQFWSSLNCRADLETLRYKERVIDRGMKLSNTNFFTFTGTKTDIKFQKFLSNFCVS